MNEIIWHNRARKQVKMISAPYREAIFDQVDKLAEPGWQSRDIKELKNHRCTYRLRGGRYRVFFDLDTDVNSPPLEGISGPAQEGG